MVNYVSIWAREVIMAVIVSIILEMILPTKSKNTKYIKTVIGIYVMYVMISPGLKLINGGEINFANVDYESYFKNEEIYSELESNVQNAENDNLKETYELSLKQDMEEKLRQKGYIVSNIKMNLNLKENSEEYGNITKLEIRLSKKNDEDNKNNEIEINKIKIGNAKDNNTINENEQKEIKDFINQEYGVKFEQININ